VFFFVRRKLLNFENMPLVAVEECISGFFHFFGTFSIVPSGGGKVDRGSSVKLIHLFVRELSNIVYLNMCDC
jgi:hypothetical protein